MANSSDKNEKEDFDALRQLSAESQNANLWKESALQVEKTGYPKFSYVVEARAESELEPEVKYWNRAESAVSILKAVDAKLESKNDMYSVSIVGSNFEQIEEQNEDDYLGGRTRLRPESPTVSKRSRSTGREKDAAEFQQLMIDHCGSVGKQAENGEKFDTEEIISANQTTRVTIEEGKIWKESQPRAQSSEFTSTGDLDPPNNMTAKLVHQPDQERFYTEALSEDTKDTEKRDRFKTMGERGKDPLSHEETTRLNMILSEPLLTIRPIESFRTDTDSMRKMSNKFSDLRLVASHASESKVTKSIDCNKGEVKSDCPELEATKLNNRIDGFGLGLLSKENSMLNKNDNQAKTSFNPLKSIDQMKMQSDKAGEQNMKASSVGNDHQSQAESYKHWHENDSITSKPSSIIHNAEYDGVVEPPSEPSLREEKPVASAANPDKLIATNDFHLDDLEALLQYNPPSENPPANLSLNDRQNSELKRLEDLLLGSIPSRRHSNTSSDDQVPKEVSEIQADTEANPELKRLEDLLLDSTPSKMQSGRALDDRVQNKNNMNEVDTTDLNPELKRLEVLLRGSQPSKIQSNTTLDDQFSDKNNEIRADTEITTLLQPSNLESNLLEKIVPITNITTDLSEEVNTSVAPDISSDYVAPIHTKSRSTETLEASISIAHQDQEEFNEEGQLSVFSDATSGQDYLRHVSNAKKQLKKIEDEMKELRGISNKGEGKNVGNNSNHRDNKGAIPPFERNCNIESVQSQIPKNNKSTEQNERGIEPPTRKQRASISDEKMRKGRRKTSKKEQVRPEKGKQNGPMDPVGKDIPRESYNKKQRERVAPPSSSKIRMKSDKSPTPNNAKNTQENRNRNDPPMMVRRSLEVEGSPTSWNDDHRSIEQRTKRKKKREKHMSLGGSQDGSRDGNESRNRAADHSKYEGHFQDDIEMNTNSVVSSRMERGDEGWSVPIDEVDTNNLMPERSFAREEKEIDGIPRHVDTKKSNHEYDPWDEVPCSCCCRYLPHTLVVATTHAYRLDHADEKDHK